MDFVDVARTTFAAREFTDDPVPDDVLYRIFDTARFAPNGGNRQGWKVIVIRDEETKKSLGESKKQLRMNHYRSQYLCLNISTRCQLSALLLSI